MEHFLTLALLLLAGHWIADYPLQGDFLATAKQKGPLRAYHLVAHAGIHGGVVAYITGNIWLGLAEWILHTVIDELKVRGKTSFSQDQALHLLCKLVWLLVIAYSLSDPTLNHREFWMHSIGGLMVSTIALMIYSVGYLIFAMIPHSHRAMRDAGKSACNPRAQENELGCKGSSCSQKS